VTVETSVVEPPSLPARAAARRNEADWRLVPLGFAALIGVGAMLLLLPWAHREGKTLSFPDAFFLSTSATCVTGLTTVNVAETFNGFGQAVLLVLIQFGGLGILTASTLLVLLSGQRLSLRGEHTIEATMGRLKAARPLDVFLYACIAVFLFEAAGFVSLFTLMTRTGAEPGEEPSLWSAAFHSISAFCNAGISVYPEGLARWRHRADLLAVVETLVIAGGLGLLTLVNLRYCKFWRQDPRKRGAVTLQTKIVLAMTVLLLGAGTALTLFFEWDGTLKEADRWEKLSWAFFHSTMSRTAGFNVGEVGQMEPPTLLGTMVLMFIGGAPGSMSGGIKTVTFFLLAATAWSALRHKEDITVFHRRVPAKLAYVATMLALLATACILLSVGLLMVTESRRAAAEGQHHWLGLMFEAVSAFGTVGLSTGVTPLLTAGGKLIVIGLMFVGRVGPLVLALHLARPAFPWHVRYPQEQVSLG
jgi:trk system potassium uptake protein TrkH